MTTAEIANPSHVYVSEEPEAAYRVPVGFGDFWPAPDLESLAAKLIEAKLPDFPEECEIVYLWKSRGGSTNGNITLGKTKLLSGDTRYFAGVDYEIWLAADHVSGEEFSCGQVEALLFHELLHVVEEEDDKGNKKLSLKGHEFEGFRREIEEYGFWRDHIKAMAVTMQGVLDLFGTPDLTPRTYGPTAQVIESLDNPDDLPADFDNEGAEEALPGQADARAESEEKAARQRKKLTGEG